MTENIHEKQSRVIEEFMKALSESQDFYDIKYILLVISRGGVRVHKFVSKALKLEEERRPKGIEMKKAGEI